jgi:hypothetical protein
MKNQIIDIDAEFDGFELDEAAINRATGMVKRRDNGWYEKIQKNAKKRSKDPEWLKKVAEDNRKKANDPEWQANHKKGLEKRAQNEEWRKNVANGYLKRQTAEVNEKIGDASRTRYNDPEWRAKHQETIKQRTNDPVWKEKQRLARLARTPAVVCNDGVFSTQQDAILFAKQQGLKNAGTKIRQWIANKENGYYLISREEYIMLTGKDI